MGKKATDYFLFNESIEFDRCRSRYFPLTGKKRCFWVDPSKKMMLLASNILRDQ